MLAILGYHHINYPHNSKMSKKLNIPLSGFNEIISYLANRDDVIIVNINDIKLLMNQPDRTKLRLALTFDDGYDNFYNYGYPILKKHKLSATLYVIASRIGKQGYCDIAMLKEMSTNGITIGCHTMNHLDMTCLSYEEQMYEVREARRILESIISRPVRSFCFPFGRYNADTLKILEIEGFESAVNTVSDLNCETENVHELKRIPSEYDDDVERVCRKLKIAYAK